MSAEARKVSFPPVVAPDCRLLILGSLPGEASLLAQRYYAHPRNQFWHLAGAVIGADLAALDYQARIDALIHARVGLWDTVASAHRKGSLDSAIRAEQHNPLPGLAAALPDLRAIAFNGRKSAMIGIPMLSGCNVELVTLPSSSPAHAGMSVAEKEQLWLTLRKFLA